MGYDIYFLQWGFYPVAVVGKVVQKYIQEEKKYTKQYKNGEYTKYKTNIKRILTNIVLVIRKWQIEANNNEGEPT